MSRTGPVVAAALAAALATPGPPAAAAQAPPGDREIRVTRDGRSVVTTLTMMLRGPGGPLAINLVLIGRRNTSRPDEPAGYGMEFQLPMYVGLRSSERPHYLLNIRTGSTDRRLVEGSVDGRLVVEDVTVVQAPLDIVSLSQLAGATAASGRLFGVTFFLTKEQISAVGEFAERVMKGQA